MKYNKNMKCKVEITKRYSGLVFVHLTYSYKNLNQILITLALFSHTARWLHTQSIQWSLRELKGAWNR